MTCQIILTILTNMTTGEFWNKVAVLANVFDGRVVTGPMSINWLRRENRNAQPCYPLGQAAEMQYFNSYDLSEIKLHADRLGLYVDEIIGIHQVVTIVPSN